MPFCEDIRSACRAVVAEARAVRIDDAALARIEPGEPPRLDPADHFLDGSPEAVATYVLALDAVNFGSGWFAELAAGRPGGFGYETVASALAERFRAAPPGPAELAARRDVEVAALFGQPPHHELTGHFGAALRELGAFLGRGGAPVRPAGGTSPGRGGAPDRPAGGPSIGRTGRVEGALGVIAAAEGSAERLAGQLAAGMPMWRDPLAKRAQLAASDLVLAGVAELGDLDALTLFADNLVPHVLRRDGALVLDPALERAIDAGELLASDGPELELRAAAVVAGERLARRLGVTERDLDGMLWQRGQAPRYADPPPHRCHTTAY